MNCRDFQDQCVAERYLAGELEPEQQEQFELHYLQCRRCSEETEALRLLRLGLNADRASIVAEPLPGRTWCRGWMLLPAGAVAVLALIAILWQPKPAPTQAEQRPAQVETRLIELAKVEPPQYTPVVLRGSAARRLFRDAMEHYQRGDYGAAIPGLESALKASSSPDVAFYLGACHLLTGQTAKAVLLFEQAASFSSPFRDEARYYMAKAHLQMGNLEQARKLLDETAAGTGPIAAKASELLEQLGRLGSESRH